MVEESKKALGFYLKKMFSASIAMSSVNAVEKIVAFTLLPILTAYLSPKDFGIISLFQITVSFLGMFYNPGILSSTVRLYYDYERIEQTKILFGSTLVFFLVFPLLVIFISFFFGNYIFNFVFDDFEFLPYGLLALISALAVQPVRLWSQFLVIQYKVKDLALWTIVSFLTGVFTSLLFVIVFKFDAFGRIAGLIIGNFLLFGVSAFTLIKFTKFRFSFHVFKKTFLLGLPISIGVWSYVINDISSRFVISKYLSLADLGIFDVGYKISSVPVLLSLGFKQVWSPIFFENMKQNNNRNISKLTLYFILFFSTACATFMLFGKEITELMINVRFHSAIKIIQLIVMNVYFTSLISLFSSFLDYEKKFLTGGIIASIAAILNVGLNFLLVPYLNIFGAAIAICFSNFIYLSIILFKSRSAIRKMLFKNKMFISNIFLITVFILNFTNFSYISFKIILLFGWLCYLLLSHNIINKEEKRIAVILIKSYYLRLFRNSR